MNLQRMQASCTAIVVTSADIIGQRQAARTMAEGLGMGLADQARVVMCVTELLENIVKHTGGGECELSLLSGQRGIRIQCSDQGHGIPEMQRVLRERADATHDLLGAGLVGVRRVADAFKITSDDHGTTICVECLDAAALKWGSH
ncbi:MAG: ATP-binding protein [Mariprofundales bacterium]